MDLKEQIINFLEFRFSDNMRQPKSREIEMTWVDEYLSQNKHEEECTEESDVIMFMVDQDHIITFPPEHKGKKLQDCIEGIPVDVRTCKTCTAKGKISEQCNECKPKLKGYEEVKK